MRFILGVITGLVLAGYLAGRASAPGAVAPAAVTPTPAACYCAPPVERGDTVYL